ncbi:MAG: endonuclease/exonuclease/phosphatase family protein [Lachnospiraceae bacterium]|nr:endonuclease/exonuclease/phosphatase family protein [Lachnospiraceae bacterium]
MKIATWNIERAQRKKKLGAIIAACEQENADILVLTEADEQVKPSGYPFCFSTQPPKAHELPPYPTPVQYAPTERRVILYTRYPCVRCHPTYDAATAICVELQTEMGNLLVYGSIIGIYGHRKPFYMDDLQGQMEDLQNLAGEGHSICFLGDYNCSFADSYYPHSAARSKMLACFDSMGMELLTKDRPECIDHIAISKSFIGAAPVSIQEWNEGKHLSDHKGIAVSFGFLHSRPPIIPQDLL